MVLSRLDPEVHYAEPDRAQGYIVDKEDIGKDVCVYELELFGHDVQISLGTERNALVSGKYTNAIIYFPVYLIVEDGVHSQIGIYEIFTGDYADLLDADDDLDLSEMPLPLLYKDVSLDYLVSASDDAIDSDEEPEGISGFTDDTAEDQLDDPAEDDFASEQARTWIETYLKSNKYTIQDNQGGGDCLFHVIVDALKGTTLGGKHISVKSLRAVLANAADEELFLNYRQLYNDYVKVQQEKVEGLQSLAKENQEIVSVVRSRQGDLSQKAELLSRGRALRTEFEGLKVDKAVSEQMLAELKFMKNVKTLGDLKHVIQSCEFWGDTWSVSTLERAMNIKLIIFSEENYRAGDIANVLLCGQLNDDKLERKGVFRPKYYILTSYSGDHYKLIRYEDLSRFTFKELPKAIKYLVVEKCMETIGGVYQLIPKFVKLKDKIQNMPSAQTEAAQTEGEAAQPSPGQPDKSLYDADIVFQFYDKSAPAKPGRGSGESIDSKDIGKFGYLATPKNMWRRKLSSQWVAPFKLDDLDWASVTHYLEALKFKDAYPETYRKFSLDSKSKWSKDPKLAEKAATKSGGGLREDEAVPDKMLSPERIQEAYIRATRAKFEQVEGMKDLLLATKDAKLMQYMQRKQSVEATDLMKLRKELAEGR